MALANTNIVTPRTRRIRLLENSIGASPVGSGESRHDEPFRGPFPPLFPQSNELSVVAVPPVQREEIRGGAEAPFVGEEKELGALPVGQSPVGPDQVLHPLGTGRDGQHPEVLDAVHARVNILFPGFVVGGQFPKARGLPDVHPLDRHGGAVGFEEEIGAVAPFRSVQKVQTEDPVGRDAQGDGFLQIAASHRPLEGGLAPLGDLRGARQDLVGLDQADPPARAAGQFQRHHHIGDQQGVVEEQGAEGAILRRPIDLAARDAAVLAQQVRPLVPQGVHHRFRAGMGVELDRFARAVQKGVVVEFGQAPQKSLTPAKERLQVGGAEKPVPKHLPDDVQVPLGDLQAALRFAPEPFFAFSGRALGRRTLRGG